MKLELRNDIFFAEVERLIGEGQRVTIPIKGHSMRPAMRNGRNKIVLAPCNKEHIKCGDVVLFRHRDHHIMHRITNIEGDNITFAGDGNYRIIEKAERKDIIAKAEAIIRPSGRTISLESRRWSIYSGIWLALPAIVRRYILAIAYRLGIWI